MKINDAWRRLEGGLKSFKFRVVVSTKLHRKLTRTADEQEKPLKFYIEQSRTRKSSHNSKWRDRFAHSRQARTSEEDTKQWW